MYVNQFKSNVNQWFEGEFHLFLYRYDYEKKRIMWENEVPFLNTLKKSHQTKSIKVYKFNWRDCEEKNGQINWIDLVGKLLNNFTFLSFYTRRVIGLNEFDDCGWWPQWARSNVLLPSNLMYSTKCATKPFLLTWQLLGNKELCACVYGSLEFFSTMFMYSVVCWVCRYL